MKNLRLVKFLIIIVSLLIISACNSAKDNNSDGNNNELDSSIKLRLLEAGGPSGEYNKVGYTDPFTEKTGIEVISESPYELGKLQAMVASKQSTYDLVEIQTSGELYQAISQGLLEKLDWSAIDPVDPLHEEAQHEYGVGGQYYSTIMAWNEDKVGEQKLTSWKDFWDVEKFPGKRTLPDIPSYTLPIALLADGVPKEELYPLDVERAFKSLEKIKDHVSVWWSSGNQPYQLLVDKEVDYAVIWSGRVVDNEDGIGYTYSEGLLDLSYFAIPKGSKHIKEAHAYLHEMTNAENTARALKILPYTGASKNIDNYLNQEELYKFPTTKENYDKQVLVDPEWWFENGKEVEEQWQLFKMSIK